MKKLIILIIIAVSLTGCASSADDISDSKNQSIVAPEVKGEEVKDEIEQLKKEIEELKKNSVSTPAVIKNNEVKVQQPYTPPVDTKAQEQKEVEVKAKEQARQAEIERQAQVQRDTQIQAEALAQEQARQAEIERQEQVRQDALIQEQARQAEIERQAQIQKEALVRAQQEAQAQAEAQARAQQAELEKQAELEAQRQAEALREQIAQEEALLAQYNAECTNPINDLRQQIFQLKEDYYKEVEDIMNEPISMASINGQINRLTDDTNMQINIINNNISKKALECSIKYGG